ncbi:MAG: sigma-70 family RNA polymerase sigma factor [Bacteroidota bacterium]
MSVHKDNRYIKRILENDPMVFKEIYKECRYSCLYWLIKKRSYNEEDAADIFQEAVATFFTNIVSKKLTVLTSSACTYLIGIAKNVASEDQKKRTRLGQKDQDFRWENLVDDLNLEDLKDREMQYEQLKQAILKLKPKCRGILLDFYFGQLSTEELAEKYKYSSLGSFKTGKYNCLQNLRELLL